MKHYFATARGLGRRLGSLAAVIALSLGGVCGAKAQAFASPVGTTWDCVISGGHQSGIAFLTFTNNATATNNATFGGYQMMVATRGASELDGRNVLGDLGRGMASGGSSSSGSGSTNSVSGVFGFMPVFGYWRFDDRGRVIGYFPEYINPVTATTNIGPTAVAQSITQSFTNGNQSYTFSTNIAATFTNLTFKTNISWTLASAPYTNTLQFTSSVTNFLSTYVVNNAGQVYTFTTNLTVTVPADTTNTVDLVWITPATNYEYGTISWVNTNIVAIPFSADSTNQVSFTASVNAGRRLSLSSTTPTGRVSYSGVPMNYNLPDLTGSWYADKRSGSMRYTEFFNLGKTVVPNIYMTTNGSGPGYQFTMITMASAQRKVGFVFSVQQGGGTNNTIGATYGPISYGRRSYKGNTTGNLEPTSSIGYSATLVLP